MKKFIAIFALLAAGATAQAQNIGDHPNARNDRAPSAMSVEHGTPAFHRAAHRRIVRHRHYRHHRHHRPM